MKNQTDRTKKSIICQIVILRRIPKFQQSELFYKLMRRKKLYLQGYWDGLRGLTDDKN